MHAGAATGYGAEAPFVLGCARRPGAQAPATELRELMSTAGFGWDRVLAFAVGHDVAPLFGRGVDEARLDLPAAIADELAGIEQSTNFHNVQLSQLLIDLMRILTDGGVRAVTFKGPALASMLYGSVGLRTSADIDLLVVPEDVPIAVELLEATGHVRRDGRTGTRRNERSVVLHDEELGVDIDVESDLGSSWYYSRPVDEALLDRAVSVDVAGRVAPSLHPEDLLQAIALRGARHRWRCWKWLCDMADLVRSTDDLDWDRMEHDARAIDHLRTVDVGLLLARDHLGAPLPDSVDDRLDADPTVIGLAGLVAEANASGTAMTTVRTHRFHLACRTGWHHKARYLGHSAGRFGRLDG